MAAEFSPLVVDETYARSTPFGGQVVPGSMISAVAIGLGSLDVPAPATAGMVGMTWRFLKPVRPGDSLHSTWRLNRKRPVENPAVGLCFWQVEVLNQRDEVVATGELGRLVQRRERFGRAVEADAAGAPSENGRSRRRRSGRTGEREPRPAPEVPAAVGEVPEPAPADVPAPARRRRRRGGRGRGGSNGVNGGNGHSGGSGPSATESAPPPPPVETSPAPPSRLAGDPSGGLRGVFRRLRGGGAEG